MLHRFEHYINSLGKVEVDPQLTRQILSLIDLTSLGETDTPAMIAALCEKAVSIRGHVAAICVYPQFASQVAGLLAETAVKTATVANFPQGSDAVNPALISIEQSIKAGAQEIDVVFPYQNYLAGDRNGAQDFVRQCKAACGEDILLKVILETGALQEPQIIADASRDVITAGADFIKTSTGKIPIGATLEAAAIMLLVINEMTAAIKRSIGFKASGGVRTIGQASQYLALAGRIMGPDWVSPRTFRLGASQLLDALV